MSKPDTALTAEFEPATREAWLTLVAKVLKGDDFDKRLVSRPTEGIALQPLYTRADTLPGGSAAVGHSGWYPGGWDVRQRHLEPDAEAANAAILEDLAGGATSVLLQVEAPGQAGLNYGEAALATALRGVDLKGVAVALDARENTMDAAGSLMELWRSADGGRGINENEWRGAFNYDPLGVLAETGGLYYPAERSSEIAAKLASDCRTLSHVTALLADGRPYHEAGASEAQELAAMLATLVAYLRACETAGLRPRMAFGKIALALAADADLFLTIAKFRAARRLIARIAEASGAGSAADGIHLSASTSERMMARRDPWVNLLRTTAACAGAAFGGAEAITVLPFTWALGKPDAFARRIARNTQLVLQAESSAARVIDPAHGSWYVETLTDDLAKAAWAIFQQIEAKGGMARALETGFIQGEIARVAEARAGNIAHGRIELTGVSAFPRLGDDGVRIQPYPPAAPMVHGKGGACVTPLVPRRLAAPFEALRDAADAYTVKTGKPPRVFLACLGDLAVHSARATWMRNYLAAGGIEAIVSDPLHSSADAGAAFAASGASIACLCSADAVYAELAEASAGALKQAGAAQLLLAGRPKEQEAALKTAGVDAFIFAGGDAVATLTGLHAALGVRGLR
ncbi:MAG TPA: methylmalonyl-CoA mutase family protein [Hyphomicrobiaceae bacterium]|nr:methylmalonyl-CoA mutase family protein [Hyphomicrobiaceae bacterium]